MISSFWLLILITLTESPQITSATRFKSESECEAARKVVNTFRYDERTRFNVYERKQVAVCEKAGK